MDATVNDFLKEINQIVPPKDKKQESAWKECIDEQTGYPYYWNVNTDEVTWEAPQELQHLTEKSKTQNKSKSLYVPPQTAPTISSATLPKDSIKIYKIQSDTDKSKRDKPKSTQKHSHQNKKSTKKYVSSLSDSEDEKIVLISSYGSDSESEDDSNVVAQKGAVVKTTNPIDSSLKSHSKIVKRVDTPADIKNPKPKEIGTVQIENKNSPAFKLVAGYGSDDEVDDYNDDEASTLFPMLPPKQVENTQPRSTLFPIPEPIDIKQFAETDKEKKKFNIEEESIIDTKAFQRKRKIDFELVNTNKKPLLPPQENVERAGFGFKSQSTVEYPGFKSGGVMFVKSDTLNPSVPNENHQNFDNSKKSISKSFEEMRLTLTEKLNFLSEVHKPVPPVQVMLIQIDTLCAAMTDGSLKANYFEKWLSDTSSELIKLEQEAAPSGWLLQWDRSNKRYYYQNKATCETQWEYPQPDVIRCDEAMDISTTPPPPDEEEKSDDERSKEPPPPPPPKISTPKPPPPPIISSKEEDDDSVLKYEPPLPPLEIAPPLPPEINYGEPLPPGVDSLEMCRPQTDSEAASLPDDHLTSALDSFYSDIAAISTESTSKVIPENATTPAVTDITVSEQVKKKKKAKVKLTQGLAMKKKGVSKLVEKWKNVQKNLD